MKQTRRPKLDNKNDQGGFMFHLWFCIYVRILVSSTIVMSDYVSVVEL